VEHWLQVASTVEGFIGFAIGRSIWWDALKGWLANDLDRAAAISLVADNYLHFVDVYERQKVA
jgi:myo-inositol catabolism protein IolC